MVATGAMSIGLSSCSPTNANGLTRIDGTPAVVNCGGWIGSVEVRDAATQRLIWMARIGDDLGDVQHPATGQVVLGELPNPAWVQIGELNVAPTPELWEFIVDEHALAAHDDELVEGRVIVDGDSLSDQQFRDDVCEEDGGALYELGSIVFLVFVTAVGAAALGLAAWAVVQQQRRRCRGPSPKRVPLPPPPPPTWPNGTAP